MLVQESCCEAECTLKIFLSFSENYLSDKNYFARNFDTVPRVHSWNLLRYGDVNFPCYVCLCVMIDVFILMIITTKTTALPSKELDASGVWFGWKIVNPTDVGYIYTILFNNMFHTNYNFEYFECILNLIKLLLINFLNYQYYVIGNIVTEKPCWKGVSIKYICM